jgi:hypothetical protein
MSRYAGREDTTGASQVARYLADNYTKADGTPVTEADARAACQERQAEINSAVAMRSYAYFPGDHIAGAMGWTALPEPDEDDEDDEYDEDDES